MSAARTKAVTRPGGKGPPLAAVLGRGDLGGSLLWIFPLFVIYGVGVLFTPSMNGVDFVTRNLYAALGYSTGRYLALYAALSVVFAGLLIYMRRHGQLHRLPFLAMLLEAAIVALTLGSFIVFVMQHLLGIASIAGPALQIGKGGPIDDVVLSIGAGVHEELVFRLGLFAGGAALLRLVVRMPHAGAMLVSALVSSLLFSAAHHVGALGEPWAVDVFVYRAIAGLAFAAIFYFRSLAHAVYAHALYDVYVGLILR
jgi:hypothetical protein